MGGETGGRGDGGGDGSDFVMLCQQNGTDCKNESLRDRRGGLRHVLISTE